MGARVRDKSPDCVILPFYGSGCTVVTWTPAMTYGVVHVNITHSKGKAASGQTPC